MCRVLTGCRLVDSGVLDFGSVGSLTIWGNELPVQHCPLMARTPAREASKRGVGVGVRAGGGLDLDPGPSWQGVYMEAWGLGSLWELGP